MKSVDFQLIVYIPTMIEKSFQCVAVIYAFIEVVGTYKMQELLIESEKILSDAVFAGIIAYE
jgi:hypothetical protein